MDKTTSRKLLKISMIQNRKRASYTEGTPMRYHLHLKYDRFIDVIRSLERHGSDFQQAELKSYDGMKCSKLLLKICQGVLKMLLDLLILLIDFQQ